MPLLPLCVYACLAGPGTYDGRLPHAVSGGRFNQSNALSMLDWVTNRALKLPGPGDYTINGG